MKEFRIKRTIQTIKIITAYHAASTKQQSNNGCSSSRAGPVGERPVPTCAGERPAPTCADEPPVRICGDGFRAPTCGDDHPVLIWCGEGLLVLTAVAATRHCRRLLAATIGIHRRHVSIVTIKYNSFKIYFKKFRIICFSSSEGSIPPDSSLLNVRCWLQYRYANL
jgi:hypothetical protein